MSHLKDLSGKQFGKLTVLRRAECNSRSGNAQWLCRCECGATTVVIGSKLLSGHTTSCGCNRLSDRAKGHSHERLYRIWRGMHRRCYDSAHDRYKWYGAKGIKVHAEWHDFTIFRRWAIANGYKDGLTIDRIDPDGDYCPENCKWADIKAQANNRTNNRYVEYRGKRYTAAELAEAFSLSPHTVYNRLRLGWETEKIVQTPERGAV